METATGLLFFSFALFGIAGGTWFFSSRRRLFIRVFVPSQELWKAARPILRQSEQQWRKPMRMMAMLQAFVAAVIGLVGLWLLLA